MVFADLSSLPVDALSQFVLPVGPCSWEDMQVAASEHASEKEELTEQIESLSAEASSLQCKLGAAEATAAQLQKDVESSAATASKASEEATKAVDASQQRLERLQKVRLTSNRAEPQHCVWEQLQSSPCLVQRLC